MNRVVLVSILLTFLLIGSLVPMTAAAQDNGEPLDEVPPGNASNETAMTPDVSAATFTNPTEIDNPYFPLMTGTVLTYSSETEEGNETIVVEVLDGTREVAGATCVVVNDQEFLDDLLIEDTHDWYAQDDDGNVWYMGEEVDNYNYDDEGNLVDVTHEGAWEAGEDVMMLGAIAQPGFIMLAEPRPGDSYPQEFYEGEAEDMAEVISLDESVTVPSGSYDDVLKTEEWTPLEPDVLEFKYYAPGVGMVLEEDAETGERVELVEIANGS